MDEAHGEAEDDCIYIDPPGLFGDDEKDQSVMGWYAFSTDKEGGIFAYFRDEADAELFRIAYLARQKQ